MLDYGKSESAYTSCSFKADFYWGADEAAGCRIYFVFWPTSHLTVITCAIIHHEMNVVLYQDFIKCGLWISGLLKSGRVWDMTVCIKESKTKLGFPGDLILTGGQE